VTGRELVLHTAGHPVEEDQEEDVLEFDLEEVDRGEAKFLAMAHYFSGKKFNAKGLFEEMRVAWGLQCMKPVMILGDNRFMLEFVDSLEARRRVADGGPWRHRGDTLLVVEYDGLSPPSSIVINSIGVWVRFYDLPDVLRKDEHARNLGERLGPVAKVDMGYPNYVRVQILFPLAKDLVPSTKVRI
jgi:hypothetical protein